MAPTRLHVEHLSLRLPPHLAPNAETIARGVGDALAAIQIPPIRLDRLTVGPVQLPTTSTATDAVRVIVASVREALSRRLG
jgi:hypothetical protein